MPDEIMEKLSYIKHLFKTNDKIIKEIFYINQMHIVIKIRQNAFNIKKQGIINQSING